MSRRVVLVEKAAKDLQIPVADVTELWEKLQAGHIVQWCEQHHDGPHHFVCQKRGEEYVTVMAHSEKKALKDWKLVNERGYFYDATNKKRVTIPGSR